MANLDDNEDDIMRLCERPDKEKVSSREKRSSPLVDCKILSDFDIFNQGRYKKKEGGVTGSGIATKEI